MQRLITLISNNKKEDFKMIEKVIATMAVVAAAGYGGYLLGKKAQEEEDLECCEACGCDDWDNIDDEAETVVQTTDASEDAPDETPADAENVE